jgi:hypothetical protein
MIKTGKIYSVRKNKHGKINVYSKNQNGIYNFINNDLVYKKIALVLCREVRDMPKGFFYKCLIDNNLFVIPSENLAEIK